MAKLTAELLAAHPRTIFVGATEQRFFEVKQFTTAAPHKYHLDVYGRGTIFHETHKVVHLSVIFWLLKELYLTDNAETSENWLPFEEATLIPAYQYPHL